MTTHVVLPMPSANTPEPAAVSRFVGANVAAFLAVVDAQEDCGRLRSILGFDA